jgi:hypothetical protein
LDNGLPRFPPGFSCPVVLRNSMCCCSISSTGLSPSLVHLSRLLRLSNQRALQPQRTEVHWFGLYPVRSPLLGVSLLISLPSGTEMFHFPEFAPMHLCIQCMVTRFSSGQVSPFGNLRIKVCLSTPRSLSQTDRVLHRLPVPRHPPYALNSFSSPRLRPRLLC